MFPLRIYEKQNIFEIENSEKNKNEPICFKDKISKGKLLKKIENIFDDENINDENIKNTIQSKLNVKRLEYCRALHAEENAFMQIATSGGKGAFGGTIYTTYFPCELCSKKIYQSGIRRIVYLEDYPKSISNLILKDGVRNLEINHFTGVTGFGYFRLFKQKYNKKDEMQKYNS